MLPLRVILNTPGVNKVASVWVAVTVTVGGAACVLLRKDVYERREDADYRPWTKEEMDLLASETTDMLAGDGLDEPDAS